MNLASYYRSLTFGRNGRLFVNVVSPPSFPAQVGFPVKVYIHGGYVARTRVIVAFSIM